MEYFQIRSFRPVETKEENTDQDRTVLRLCDGFLAVPTGSLSSGPTWHSLWGINDLPAQCAAALAGADATKAHFVKVSRGNHVWLVVWSLSLSKPLGIFYVTTGVPADFDFDSTDTVTFTSTNNSVYRDKSGALPWFASRIADRWYFGNGTNDNVQWKDGALVALGGGVPGSIYNPSRAAFPPCVSFVMNETKSILAAGNVTYPKRIWIAHPPTKDYPFNEGVYDLSTSHIDLNYSEATKITALTAFQNYVTAHTDAKPVNVFDIDGTNDGWKCRQAPGAANSSAPSPAAVRDTNGMASFYLGADGEVYEDQAIRVGPHDKRAAREQDIATRLGAGDWNMTMKTPVPLGSVHTVYDRVRQMYWIFAELDALEGRFGLWAYNERNRSVTGPFSYPNAVVSAVVAGSPDGSSTYVGVVTAAGEMLYADLSNIGEVDEFMQESSSEPLGDAFAELDAQPTATPGMSSVGMTAAKDAITEFLDAETQVTMDDMWSDFSLQDGSQVFTRFWKDAYVARAETAYEDFGDARLRKNYLEIAMTWQRHSRAYVGVYVESDGCRRGRWLGLVFNKETHRIPLNVEGRRIRVRLVAVLFNAAPALLREISIGWRPAGST